MSRSPRASRIVTISSLLAVWLAPAAVEPQVVEQGPKLPTALGALKMFGMPANVFTAEGTCAPPGACASADEGAVEDYAGFGFIIPDGVTITGIKVRIGANGGMDTDEPELQLLYDDWSSTSEVRTVSLPGQGGYIEVDAGSCADKWGVAWTPAMVNDPEFGIRIADVDAPGGFRIDYVAITICYEGPPPPPPPVHGHGEQRPRYSVGPDGPSECDPADILILPGSGFPPCSGAGSPEVFIPCADLTFPGSCVGSGGEGPPFNDDVAALDFGGELSLPKFAEIFFSADFVSEGCPSSAVAAHAAEGHPGTDEFRALPPTSGTACAVNELFYSAAQLGLIENAGTTTPIDDDELDALSWPEGQPYFTLAPDSPTLNIIGAFPSDILTTAAPGAGPSIAVDHMLLGLIDEDFVDALCMHTTDPSLIAFSLAPGSPSLAGPDGLAGTADDFSPADLLHPGPTLYLSAGSIGLLASDNLDAVKCSPDCNLNGEDDALDIGQGSSPDCNLDGVPDECELAGADTNQNGILDECESNCPPGALDLGPAAGFQHAHPVGAACPGTGINGDPSSLMILGAGQDIWKEGDQFFFAYSEVTGNFDVKVTITAKQFPAVAPASRWGKFGIMARQDCTPKSRYSFIHESGEQVDSARFAYRPTHGGTDNAESFPPGEFVVPDTLRLVRSGGVFTGYILDDAGFFGGVPGEWFELGSHDWGAGAPETVLVGLAVSSHEACEITTIGFGSYELATAPPPPPLPVFHRGDVDGNGNLEITDGIRILNNIFLGGSGWTCEEAANVNDDTDVDLSDAVFLFLYLFLGGLPPPPPGPTSAPCGLDPPDSPSNLGCVSYAGPCF